MLFLFLLPKALLTKMGVSYFTREKPELYNDIYYDFYLAKGFVTETFCCNLLAVYLWVVATLLI